MKIILFLSLLLGPLAEARTANLVTNLISSGFSCEEKITEGCHYTECNGVKGFYPQTLYFAIPDKVSGLRLHFHGHVLNAPETRVFEGLPAKMVAGFGLEKEVCRSEEALLIPQSLGKNDTYKKLFAASESWQLFVRNIQEVLRSELPVVHLSGHSGGGKFVALALENNVLPRKVSIYDGIYSELTRQLIEKYVQEKMGTVVLAAVAEGSPDQFITPLVKKFQLEGKSEKLKGQSYMHFSSESIHYYRRLKSEGLAHFHVVTETWSTP